MSIRRKLFLSICIPLLVGFLILLVFDYKHSITRATQFAEQRVQERAAATAAQFDERLGSVKGAADMMAGFLENRTTISEQQLRTLLIQAMRPGSWVSGSLVSFGDTMQRGPRVPAIAGMRRMQGGPPGPPQVENLEQLSSRPGPILTKPRETKTGVWFDPSQIDLPSADGKISAYSVSYFGANQEYGGTVAVSLNVSDLQHLRDEPQPTRRGGRRGNASATGPTSQQAGPFDFPSIPGTPLTKGGYVVIDRQGNLISQPNGERIDGFIARAEKLSPELADACHKALDGSSETVTISGLSQLINDYAVGEDYVVAAEPVRTTGWIFLTAVPKSELLGPIQSLLLNRAVMFSILMIVPLAVVAFVSRRFCKPIELLAKRVQEISDGELDLKPLPVQTNDEIGRLSGGFNLMTEQLRHHVEALTVQSAAREKVESELRIARQIQSDLLPRTFPPFPDRHEFELHAVNYPARHIAGDFFDFFFVSPDKLVIVIADVSGKGVPAALLMAVTRTVVRNFASAGLSPVQIAERANDMLVADSEPGMFATMFIAEYQPSTGRIVYVNAGHPRALRYGTEGHVEFCCDSTGPIIGVSSDGELGPFVEATIQLQPGEGILLYTDGVTEARDGDEMFAEQRLKNTLIEVSDGTSREVCTRIADRVSLYQHGQLVDDLTLLSLRRLS